MRQLWTSWPYQNQQKVLPTVSLNLSTLFSSTTLTPFLFTNTLYVSENDFANDFDPKYRLCPLLNGTMKQQDGFTESAFAIGAPPAV